MIIWGGEAHPRQRGEEWREGESNKVVWPPGVREERAGERSEGGRAVERSTVAATTR